MSGNKTEYEVESLFIDRLQSIGYEFVQLKNYDDVLANFRTQLAAFNSDKLISKKGSADFSDAEFKRVMIHINNHTVYESAKILRDKQCYSQIMENLYILISSQAIQTETSIR